MFLHAQRRGGHRLGERHPLLLHPGLWRDGLCRKSGELCGGKRLPLAADFRDFLRLLLSCGTTTALEQIVWWTEAQFLAFLAEEARQTPPERTAVLARIQEAFQLEPMDHPFQYVKTLQAGFDRSRLRYTGEYYEVTGRARPDGACAESRGFEFPRLPLPFSAGSKTAENDYPVKRAAWRLPCRSFIFHANSAWPVYSW